MKSQVFRPFGGRSLAHKLIERGFAVLFAAILAHCLPPNGLAQDAASPEVRVSQAKAEFNRQQEAARTRLLAAYSDALRALTAVGRISDATKLAEEMKAFENSGILLGSSGLQQAITEYGRAVKGARALLAASYDQAIKELTRSGESSRAGDLLKELSVVGINGRLVSLSPPGRRNVFVQHGNYLGWAKPVTSDGERLNATFELVPGLADSAGVSFRLVNVPAHYLAHGDFRLRAVRFDPSVFGNATFMQTKGLGSTTGVSFESVNCPGRFIRVRGNGEVWLDKNDGSPAFRSEATFVIAEPQYRLW